MEKENKVEGKLYSPLLQKALHIIQLAHTYSSFALTLQPASPSSPCTLKCRVIIMLGVFSILRAEIDVPGDSSDSPSVVCTAAKKSLITK